MSRLGNPLLQPLCRGTSCAESGRCGSPLKCCGLPADDLVRDVNAVIPPRLAHVPVQPDGPYSRPPSKARRYLAFVALAALMALVCGGAEVISKYLTT